MPIVSLDKKTIILVGAGGQLGRVLSRSLLDAGANVLLVDSSAEALQRLEADLGEQAKVQSISADITHRSSVQAAFGAAIKRFGGVDGAVNCAYPRNPNYGRKFFDVEYEDFAFNVSAHLGGYFLFMQQCAKYAIESGRDFSLVSMSSIYGVMAPRFEVYEDTPMTMPVEYAAIKSALQHLTSYVTNFTRGSRFRANCVSPGGIFAEQNELFLQRYKEFCRIKGMLDSKDVVGAVLFLLSDAAEFVCGQNIVVDDGFSC